MLNKVHKMTAIAIFLLVQYSRSHPTDDLFLNEQWKLVTSTYLKYDSTKAFLDLMKQKFPENINFYSIGKSVQGREM